MYQYLIKRIIEDAELNFYNANNKDVERSAYTAGHVAAYANILSNIGHSVNHGDWEDDGCLRVGCLEIDGKVLIKNSVINYENVAEEYKK